MKTDITNIAIRTEKVYDDFFTDRLLEPVIVETRYHGTVTIPAGFLTDFASSPRWAWILVPKRGIYDLATLVHDYLYREKIGTRKLADLEQYYLMKELGAALWQINGIYIAVRLAGQKRWKELSK